MEKRRAAAENINIRADEIERFVSEITKAASEDFIRYDDCILSCDPGRLAERLQNLIENSIKW